MGTQALRKPRVLVSGDRVRFGVAYTIFRLVWAELEVTSSMLRDREEKLSLSGWLEAVSPGARLLANMSSSTTHLVMNTISLSIKVGQEVKLRINSTQITITHYT